MDERGYSLGKPSGKPHVVYGLNEERLGVYHTRDAATYPQAIVRRDCVVPVWHKKKRNFCCI